MFNFNLDIERETYLVNKAKEGDDRQITLEMYQNGEPYDLTGATIVLKGKNQVGGGVTQTENIAIDKNHATIQLDRNFTRIPGNVELEATVSKSGKQITTFTFNLVVKESVLTGADLNPTLVVDTIEVLTNKIIEADKVKLDLDKSIANGDTAKMRADINLLNTNIQTKADKTVVENLTSQMDNMTLQVDNYKIVGMSDDDLFDLVIDKAIKGNKKRLKLSARTYNITRSHLIEFTQDKEKVKGVFFEGDGVSTIINCMNDIDGVFKVKSPSVLQHTSFKNLKFNTNGYNVVCIDYIQGGLIFEVDSILFVGSDTNPKGIAIRIGEHNSINNVNIKSCYTHGFNVGIDTNCDMVTIDKCTIRSCNYGVTSDNIIGVFSMLNIKNTELFWCGNSIYFDAESGKNPFVLNIEGCRIESSKDYDIYINGYSEGKNMSRNINIRGNYFTNALNTSKGSILKKVNGVTIEGNNFKDYTLEPFNVYTSTNIWIYANTFLQGTTTKVVKNGVELCNILEDGLQNTINKISGDYINQNNYGGRIPLNFKYENTLIADNISGEHYILLSPINEINMVDGKINICRRDNVATSVIDLFTKTTGSSNLKDYKVLHKNVNFEGGFYSVVLDGVGYIAFKVNPTLSCSIVFTGIKTFDITVKAVTEISNITSLTVDDLYWVVPTQQQSVANDIPSLKNDLNYLLTLLKQSGFMKKS